MPNLSLRLYSLRSGGPSTAAVNSVPDRFILKHGWLKSEKGRDGYTKDSISDGLEVTKTLGQ